MARSYTDRFELAGQVVNAAHAGVADNPDVLHHL